MDNQADTMGLVCNVFPGFLSFPICKASYWKYYPINDIIFLIKKQHTKTIHTQIYIRSQYHLNLAEWKLLWGHGGIAMRIGPKTSIYAVSLVIVHRKQ